MEIENKALLLAKEFVLHTNKNIFLTGKAGTGKTTFLRNLKLQCPKRMAIVAPTGVAAINAGGVTIHSFFQIPFGPFVPFHKSDDENAAKNAFANHNKLNREKILTIKGLDLLVIDEISMVRADLLDAIDAILRRHRDKFKPFGGVQLLMIGDLHQLSPIVKEEEWEILREYYKSIYFFDSLALQLSNPQCIELQHIYRQSDTVFIDLLNNIRNNDLTPETIQKINSRYIPNFKPNEDEGYITLSTHNNKANTINQENLKKLNTTSQYFDAKTEGDFPANIYPNDERLELKEGAQVMFVKNDTGREKQYYNGKIGKITKINEDYIVVKCPSDKHEINVYRTEWQNIKYKLNQETKLIDEDIIGTFTQFPLKLAWAITIHKSQGLTFEKIIIDANAAFAPGQVYVALSRCKTLEGIVLSSMIDSGCIKSDYLVSGYTKENEKNPPTENKLNELKKEYQQQLILELFDFKQLENIFQNMLKILAQNISSLDTAFYNKIKDIEIIAYNEIMDVSRKFTNQLIELFKQNETIESNEAIQSRINKACLYFLPIIKDKIYTPFTEILIETDNKTVKKTIIQQFEIIQLYMFVKQQTMEQTKECFTTLKYLQTKANAEIDFKPKIKEKEAVKELKKSSLIDELKNWRNEKAEERNIEPYKILHQNAIKEIAKTKPLTYKQLAEINGIGKLKLKEFGDEILSIVKHFVGDTSEIINDYIEEPAKPKKESTTDTKAQSFELFKQGNTINEIAEIRKLSNSTIEGHLAHYVKSGDISIHKLVEDTKIMLISDVYKLDMTAKMTEVKSQLPDEITYSEIKFVKNYLDSLVLDNE